MRHIDATYWTDQGSLDLVKEIKGRKLAIDFFIVFAQSLVFASLSFYLTAQTEFFTLFTALLIVDVAWFLSLYEYVADEKVFRHQKKWTMNNSAAILALLIAFIVSRNLSSSVQLVLFSTVIALNTLADFVISWEFYFPTLPGRPCGPIHTDA